MEERVSGSSFFIYLLGEQQQPSVGGRRPACPYDSGSTFCCSSREPCPHQCAWGRGIPACCTVQMQRSVVVFRSVGTPLAGWYWGSGTEGTLWMQGPSPLLLLPLRAVAEACALGKKYAMGNFVWTRTGASGCALLVPERLG